MTAESHPADEEALVETDAAIQVAAFRATLLAFLRESEQVVRKERLTPQHYMLLLMIKGAPDGTQRSTVTDLAERLQLAQNTVSELVRRAEQRNLVRRESSQIDARVAYLRITSEGEHLLARAFSRHEDERRKLRQMLAQLDQSDQPDRCEETVLTNDTTLKPEQIVTKLHEAERLLDAGTHIVTVCRQIGISVQTYQRWRAQYRSLGSDDIMRLKKLEKENTTLKRLLAEKELDNEALREMKRNHGTPSPGG